MNDERYAEIKSRMDLIEFRINQHLFEEVTGKKEILAAIAEVTDFQRKQKGFIGGVILTITAIWAALQFAVPWLKPN